MTTAPRTTLDYSSLPQSSTNIDHSSAFVDDPEDIPSPPSNFLPNDCSKKDGEFPESPEDIPRGSPTQKPRARPVGLSLNVALESSLSHGQRSQIDEQSDWSLWWGTFQGAPSARLQIWRCSPTGLNVGDALLTITLEDARRMHFDDYATALAYLSNRFGSGRFRFTPRNDQGSKLPGTQSITAIIHEDPMHVTMQPSLAASTLPPPAPIDRETAIEIERLRLQSEVDRERDTRRERQREGREERRRDRELDRERKREEERKRRDEDERRRSDRELQMHTLMVQMLKEVAVGRSGGGKDDALLAAVLTKIGQPDPLVLKLLDTHGKREELTDFFKVQAESMRMASSLQTDSLKQVMVTSQEVQAQLMRQAAEVAINRDSGGDGWSGIGSVLSATANIVAALRGSTVPSSPTPVAPATQRPSADITREQRPALSPPPPRIITATTEQQSRSPSLPSTAAMSDQIGDSLRQVRSVHRGEQPDDEDTLHLVADVLPDPLANAIRSGDVVAIQREVMPAVQVDSTLADWLGQPGIGDWLTSYLQRLRAVLCSNETSATNLTMMINSSITLNDDPVI